MDAEKFIAEAKVLFPTNNRPKFFLPSQEHCRVCSECAEHEETLQAHNPESIGLEQLGNSGWDPICYIIAEGYKYYFSALVRLAINDIDKLEYIDLFLYGLVTNGADNRRFSVFSEDQKKFVQNLLIELVDSIPESKIKSSFLDEDFDRALEYWEI
ncbi:MAG: hypothetical protein ACQ9MH_02480 [Nitrospinales bacterium]